MEKSAPETESAKGRVPGKAMGHASVIQGPQEKPAVNVLTVIFCHIRQGILNKLESHYSPRYSSKLLDPILPRLQLV